MKRDNVNTNAGTKARFPFKRTQRTRRNIARNATLRALRAFEWNRALRSTGICTHSDLFIA